MSTNLKTDSTVVLTCTRSFGTISLGFWEQPSSSKPKPGTLWSYDDPSAFCDDASCTFVFRDTNPASVNSPVALPIAATTNRSVTATSQCVSHKVVKGGSGTLANITIIDTGDIEKDVQLPFQAGNEQSTFMTDVSSVCGPNCSYISVFEASSTDAWFYNCTVSLDPVANATRPEHYLGQQFIRRATSAIALQGYSTTPSDVSNLQAVVYPAASIFGQPLNGSSSEMQEILSRFTIGVVLVAADANSNIIVPGNTPYVGQKINIKHWDRIHLIFALTAGLQLLLAVAAAWFAERTVVPDGGPIAEAHVVQSMTKHRVAEQDDLDEEYLLNTPHNDSNSRWIYKAEYLGRGVYDLYMEEVPGPGSAPQELPSSQSLDPQPPMPVQERSAEQDTRAMEKYAGTYGHAPEDLREDANYDLGMYGANVSRFNTR